jgi:hypothetical protein
MRFSSNTGQSQRHDIPNVPEIRERENETSIEIFEEIFNAPSLNYPTPFL